MVHILELYEYQKEAVRQVYTSLANDRVPVVTLQGGLGKTLIAAEIARRGVLKGERTLIYCPLKTLPRQFWRAMMNVGLTPDQCAILAGTDSCDTAHINRVPVVIAMAQTIRSKGQGAAFIAANRGTFTTAIYDEAHISLFDAARSLVPVPKEIGLTATPWRMDGSFDLNIYDLIQPITGAQAVTMGKSTPLTVMQYSDNYAPVCVSSKGDITVADAEAAIGDMPKEYVLETWLAHHPKGSHTIGFMPSIDRAKEWAQWFTDQGFKSEAVTSDMASTKERLKTYARLRDGTTKILFTVTALATGFDEPSAECCLFLRETRSLAMWCQSLWRVTRKHPGKTRALCLDYVGNSTRHPHPEEISDWRNIPQPGGQQCEACERFNPRSASCCAHCGHVFEKPEKQVAEYADLSMLELEDMAALVRQEVAGLMVAIEAVTNMTPLEAFRQLRRRSFLDGKAPGYAYIKYQEIFGTKPPRYDKPLLECSIFPHPHLDNFFTFYMFLLGKTSDRVMRGQTKAQVQAWVWNELRTEFGDRVDPWMVELKAVFARQSTVG
jgi:DNA repair protein RadD